MNGLLLPAIVSSIRSLKDGSVSVCVETQEITPMKAGELFSLRNKVVVMYLSEKDTIPQKELDQVDSLEVDTGGKSQSQRIRNVLYRVFEQQPEGYKDFELFYRAKTEKIIEHLKSKLT
jgi:hypothetical protein